MQTLPKEIITQELLLSLPIKDIFQLCQVSKRFAQLCNESQLWEKLFQRDYPAVYDVLKVRKRGIQWKKLYRTFYDNPFLNNPDTWKVIQYIKRFKKNVDFAFGFPSRKKEIPPTITFYDIPIPNSIHMGNSADLLGQMRKAIQELANRKTEIAFDWETRKMHVTVHS